LAEPPDTRRTCVGRNAAAKAGLWVMATMAPLKPCSAPAGGGGWGWGGGQPATRTSRSRKNQQKQQCLSVQA
jgi:hypothetical protein